MSNTLEALRRNVTDVARNVTGRLETQDSGRFSVVKASGPSGSVLALRFKLLSAERKMIHLDGSKGGTCTISFASDLEHKSPEDQQRELTLLKKWIVQYFKEAGYREIRSTLKLTGFVRASETYKLLKVVITVKYSAEIPYLYKLDWWG